MVQEYPYRFDRRWILKRQTDNLIDHYILNNQFHTTKDYPFMDEELGQVGSRLLEAGIELSNPALFLAGEQVCGVAGV